MNSAVSRLVEASLQAPDASSETGPVPRIVSLIPSATEIVTALGYGDFLVGRSHECDYPAAVTALPICTEPKFDPKGSSAEIHERVTGLLASALSVYRVKSEVLAELRPTHIITQAQCEVCAVSLGDVEKAVTDLVAAGHSDRPPIQVVSLQPMCLTDMWADMERVAVALAGADAGAQLAEKAIAPLKARLRALSPVSSRPDQSAPRPKVACIEWTEPLMAAGNWVPELVALAGGDDCFGKVGAHSDWMSWADLAAAGPDIIVVMPCGYDMAQTQKATEEMSAHPEWTQLSAVKNNRVYLTDGNQYFNRPGPRLVESYEILAEIIQGQPVDETRYPRGWRSITV